MKLSTVVFGSLALALTGITIYMSMNPSNEESFAKEFAQFRLKYKKLYASKSELQYRYEVFAQAMREIKAHPKDSSYQVGVNQFTDLTWDEFKQGYLQEDTPNTLFEGEAPLTKDIDHTEYTTGVKNQGMCGSCWAFSTTGSFEYFLNKKDEKKGDDRIDLSE